MRTLVLRNTIDFLLTAKGDAKAALRFLKKAIGRNGINQFNNDNNQRIKIRQCKYLNNIVEQDHRRIKRISRPMLGFKNFHTAQSTLKGIEPINLRQNQ